MLPGILSLVAAIRHSSQRVRRANRDWMRARLRKFFKLPGIVRGEQAEIPAMMPPQLAQTFQIGKARPVRRRDQASSEIRMAQQPRRNAQGLN
jgi:hypothetical protein